MAGAATMEALAPRTMPRQNRAIERRRGILDATLALLKDHAIDEITTSLIAARARVPVASVYGYFPNKMAVIAELMREAMKEVDTRIEAMLVRRPDAGVRKHTIDSTIDTTIDAIVEDYRMVPAHRRLFSAVRGNAALEPVAQESDARITGALTETLTSMRPDLPPLHVRAIAQTVVQTFTALQEGVVVCADPDMFAALVEEWRALIKAYLAPITVKSKEEVLF